jgi:hypothetical protein
MSASQRPHLSEWAKILRTTAAFSVIASTLAFLPTHAVAQADCDEDGRTDDEELFGGPPIYAEDFSGDTSDITLSGLWRISATDDCFIGVDSNTESGLPAAFYNAVRDDGEGTVCDFDTGETTFGRLETPVIQLPPLQNEITLWWTETSQGENGDPFDAHRIYVRDVATGAEFLVFEDGGSFGWFNSGLELTPFQGKDVQIIFEFDSVDEIDNSGFGWVIDDILIFTFASDCDESGVPDECEYVALSRFPQANQVLAESEDTRVINISFTSPVQGLTAGSFEILPVAGNLTGEITGIETEDDTNFEITVGNITGEGIFRLNFIDEDEVFSTSFQPGFLVRGIDCDEDASTTGPLFVRSKCGDDINALYGAVLGDNGTPGDRSAWRIRLLLHRWFQL